MVTPLKAIKATVLEVSQTEFERYISERCGNEFDGSAEDGWYEGVEEISATKEEWNKDNFFDQDEVDEFESGEVMSNNVENYVRYLVHLGELEEGTYIINLES